MDKIFIERNEKAWMSDKCMHDPCTEFMRRNIGLN